MKIKYKKYLLRVTIKTVLVFILAFVTYFLLPYIQNDITNDQLHSDVVSFIDDGPVSDKSDGDIESKITNNRYDYMNKYIDFDKLLAISPYANQWITIPGLNIDQVCMSEPKPYEFYFLNRNIYGNYTSLGSIVEVKQPDIVKNNRDVLRMIMGHNGMYGRMFGGIKKYMNSSFFNNSDNKHMYIYTPTYVSEFEVVSITQVTNTHNVYNTPMYMTDDATHDIISNLRNNAIQNDKSINITAADEVVVLSTCHGHSGTSNRLILVLRLTRERVYNI